MISGALLRTVGIQYTYNFEERLGSISSWQSFLCVTHCISAVYEISITSLALRAKVEELEVVLQCLVRRFVEIVCRTFLVQLNAFQLLMKM